MSPVTSDWLDVGAAEATPNRAGRSTRRRIVATVTSIRQLRTSICEKTYLAMPSRSSGRADCTNG
jgi:hypothetical protein